MEIYYKNRCRSIYYTIRCIDAFLVQVFQGPLKNVLYAFLKWKHNQIMWHVKLLPETHNITYLSGTGFTREDCRLTDVYKWLWWLSIGVWVIDWINHGAILSSNNWPKFESHLSHIIWFILTRFVPQNLYWMYYRIKFIKTLLYGYFFSCTTQNWFGRICFNTETGWIQMGQK